MWGDDKRWNNVACVYIQWHCDTAGNLITKKDGTTTHSYTYGNAKWRDLLTAYDGNSITYDGCGNPTKYHDGKTFTWTQGRRLSAIGTTISYSYDMAGVRSSKTVSGTTYSFTTLSGLVTRQEWGSNHIDFFYDENNQPFALNYNGTMYYYVLNAQGDVVGIMNSSKTLVATYTYDPWGKVITSTGTLASVNPLRYRGYYYDTETGFYYLQSRYYDPSIGRFINADSYASTDASGILSTNMFAYCENDPVNNSDATGEAFSLVAMAIGATVNAAVNVAGTIISNVATGQKWSDGLGVAALSGAVTGAVSTASMNPLARLAISAAVSGAESVYDQLKNDGSINIGKLATDSIAGAISGQMGYVNNSVSGSLISSGRVLKGQIGNAFKGKGTVKKLKKAGKNYLKRTNTLYRNKIYGYKAIRNGIVESAATNIGGYYVWR